MSKSMRESESAISNFFDCIPSVATTSARPDAKVEFINQAIEAIRSQKSEAKLKEEAKQFVEKTKMRQQPIRDSENAWSRENRYVLHPGVTEAQHLTNIQQYLDVTKTLNRADLSWLGVAQSGDITTPQGAEFIARLSILPPNLLNDPYILYQEAARLSCSCDASMGPSARNEVNLLLNKTILRIRELEQQNPTLGMDDEEVIYKLRGFVYYDEELDGPINDPIIKSVIEKQTNQINAMGTSNKDREHKDLERLRKTLLNGKVELVQNGQRTFHTYDLDKISPYVERLNRHINSLEETFGSRNYLNNWEPNTTDEFISGLEEHMLSGRNLPDSIRRVFNTLNHEQQEECIHMVQVKIRRLLARLEVREADRWQAGYSFEQNEMLLGRWIDVLESIDHRIHHQMQVEEQSRKWYHMLIHTMDTGASPFDTKRLLEIQQDFDKMEYISIVSELPGVSNVVSLLDARFEEYFQSESHPEDRLRFEQSLIHDIQNSNRFRGHAEGVDGITADDAVRLGMRVWRAFGREAQMYRNYIRKNKLIVIREDHGVTKAFVDRNAPIKWDPMRLIMCPEALWIYFGFGANEAGETVTFKNLRGESITARSGRGVGAEVLKILLQEPGGFDLCIQDMFSRRKGLILDAWISKKLSERPPDDLDHQAWEAKIELLKHTPGANNALLAEVYEFQQSFLKKKMNIEFAREFGTQVWELSKSDSTNTYTEIQNKVREFREQAHGDPQINRILDHIEDGYTQADFDWANERNESIQMRRNGTREWTADKDPSFNDAFDTMNGMDISKIPFEWFPRLQEAVRGNFRDTFTAINIYSAVGDFINNPTVDFLMKIPLSQAKGYTSLSNIQARMIMPIFNALVAVQRGKGPLGFDLGLPFLRSKFGKIRDIASLDDLDFYKIIRQMEAEEFIDRDMAYKLQGGLAGWFKNQMLVHADPVIMAALLFSLMQKQVESISKDIEKS